VRVDVECDEGALILNGKRAAAGEGTEGDEVLAEKDGDIPGAEGAAAADEEAKASGRKAL
jgi:hypothetical protein